MRHDVVAKHDLSWAWMDEKRSHARCVKSLVARSKEVEQVLGDLFHGLRPRSAGSPVAEARHPVGMLRDERAVRFMCAQPRLSVAEPTHSRATLATS